MFKLYTFRWQNRAELPERLQIFLHCQTRPKGGFRYRAKMIGEVPRLDDISASFAKYSRNSKRLASAACIRRPSTFEPWPGQSILRELWERVANLSFVDMGQISLSNPFTNNTEPEHEDLLDPEDVFGKQTQQEER